MGKKYRPPKQQEETDEARQVISTNIHDHLRDFYRTQVKLDLMDENRPLRFYAPMVSSKNLQDMIDGTVPFVEPLGEDGVFSDGIPFYHMRRGGVLTKDERLRIVETGVKLAVTRFSPAEDRQIRRNWKEYCKITQQFHPNESAEIFSAANPEKKHGKVIVKEPMFCPFICRGMVNRTGIQVFRRAYILFHPGNSEDGGYSRVWTQLELQRLVRMVKKHGQQWEAIGLAMKRPRFHCYRRYKKLMDEEQFSDDDATLSTRFKFDALLIGTKAPEVIASYESRLNWSEIAAKVGWEEAKCKQYWNDLKKAIAECVEDFDSNDPRLIRRALPMELRALSAITAPTTKSKYTPKKVASALECFIKVNKDSLVGKFQDCEALADLEINDRRLMARHVFYALQVFNANGFFESLPKEHSDVYTQLQAVLFAAKKQARDEIPYLKLSLVGDTVIQFIEENGWTPTKREFLCHKLGNVLEDERIEESERQRRDSENSNDSLGVYGRSKSKRKSKQFVGDTDSSGDSDQEGSPNNDVPGHEEQPAENEREFRTPKSERMSDEFAWTSAEDAVNASLSLLEDDEMEEPVKRKKKKRRPVEPDGEEMEAECEGSGSARNNINENDGPHSESSRKKRKTRALGHEEEGEQEHDGEQTKKRKKRMRAEPDATTGDDEQALQSKTGEKKKRGDDAGPDEEQREKKRRKRNATQEAVVDGEESALNDGTSQLPEVETRGKRKKNRKEQPELDNTIEDGDKGRKKKRKNP